MTRAALEVAAPVERLEDFFGELSGLRENGLHHIKRGIREPRQIAEPLIAEHVAQKEKRILDRSLVAGHRASPAAAALSQ